MNSPRFNAVRRAGGLCALGLAIHSLFIGWQAVGADKLPGSSSDPYHFDRTISREVLENYLSRAITMEGLLNGQGDLDDNIRMLKSTGAKFVGRSLCLWGGEANLPRNLERAKWSIPQIR
ncbi:MAG: hypothetical protein NT154_17155 [Verrucomicrobia bacterium]|nr:hypothetical protein [Verrucomicrobiota bacterium]